MQELEQALALARLEFLKTLDQAGVEFSVCAIDGTILIKSTEILEYLDNRPAFLAKRAGVTLEEWQRWKDYVARGNSVSLREFLIKPPYQKSNQSKPKIPDPLRWEVWERDNFTCKSCGARQDLTIDHIVPESKGGKTIKDNLQTLCRSCNSKKGCNG
jgi:hypothetical protein